MTEKQLELITFIRNFWQTHKFGPSYDEMKNACEIKSKSRIHDMVKSLEAQGLITRLGGPDCKRKRNLIAASSAAECPLCGQARTQ